MVTTRTCASYVAMIVVQLSYGGSSILAKISLEKGMNQQVFIVYRHLIAMLVLAPLAYAFERKTRPPLPFTTIMKIFVLASLGSTLNLNLYYAGLKYTSPTVATALTNVTPSLTFLIAVSLGMERVMLRSIKGQAKIIGALVCVGGALIFTFWKGDYLLRDFNQRPLINIHNTKGSLGSRHHENDWIKGSALVLASNAAWSAWFILQALICKDYPANLSLNTLICFFASLQSTVLGFILDRQATSWKLGWNVQLFTIVYCGVLNSALVYFLQTWCINEKGPVFVAMFSPLLLIIIAIFSAIAFAERLHVGSFIGSVIIIFGLYCVLWGKTKDGSVEKKPDSKESSFNTQKLEIILDCELAIEQKTSEEKDRPALLSSGSLSKQASFSKM
ncbi:hypothetical protein IFM89_023948 [Coptis chinensis]|uniref:WAT1-related protein n=1 Tax=Coptis chinensis TaxID=261450 RepID=A0A835LSK9_9MAGN|nr:hypothetical protein IFM89_023948 [Coptis chinensis]